MELSEFEVNIHIEPNLVFAITEERFRKYFIDKSLNILMDIYIVIFQCPDIEKIFFKPSLIKWRPSPRGST